MATYPTTAEGAVCQYPVERKTLWRMVQSESGGLVRWRRRATGKQITWRLSYDNLSDAETRILDDFYIARRGSLESFTFVDPLANALAASDRPDDQVWQASGASATNDEAQWQGHRLLQLSSRGWLQQSVEVAAHVYYCASAWVRGTAGLRFRVDLAGNPADVYLTGAWQRCWSRMSAADTDGVVQVRFENLSTEPLEIAGLCMEAQPYPGESRVDGSGRSLYRKAHFANGGFMTRAMGPNRNSVSVVIEASIEEEA